MELRGTTIACAALVLLVACSKPDMQSRVQTSSEPERTELRIEEGDDVLRILKGTDAAERLIGSSHADSLFGRGGARRICWQKR